MENESKQVALSYPYTVGLDHERYQQATLQTQKKIEIPLIRFATSTSSSGMYVLVIILKVRSVAAITSLLGKFGLFLLLFIIKIGVCLFVYLEVVKMNCTHFGCCVVLFCSSLVAAAAVLFSAIVCFVFLKWFANSLLVDVVVTAFDTVSLGILFR